MPPTFGAATRLPNQEGEPRQLHLHFCINSEKITLKERFKYISIYLYIYIYRKGQKKANYWLVFLSGKKKAEIYPLESFNLMGLLPLHLNPGIDNNTKTLAKLS